MADNFLQKHIETVQGEAKKLEKELCETEDMNADEICRMLGAMQNYIGATNYLMQMDAIINKPIIQKPGTLKHMN